MCTATWWSDAGRYELFFSRDERRDRSPERPPALNESGSVQYLCPRDPDGGGTWLLVNDAGLSICLLNQYPDPPAPRSVERISRGQLVESLASSHSVEAVESILATKSLEPYDGFLLLAIGRTGARRFLWDTYRLEIQTEEEIQQPLSSSSYMSQEVLVTREHLFAEMVAGQGDPSPEKLHAFHHHFMPDASTHSVFMQREDSQTVSLCHVVVSADNISLGYAPKDPDAPRFLEPVRHDLKPAFAE